MTSDMVIDPPDQVNQLDQLLRKINGMSDPSQFIQGVNAKPALMLDLIQRLSERHVDYLSQKEQLDQANDRIKKLECRNTDTENNGTSRDADGLLRKLVGILGSKDHEPTYRTSEIRDSEPFSGNKKDLTAWKEYVMLKLNVNASHYPSDQSKMA
ncbi:hypothetical protein K3495_g9728 [Podosphaera aphanis]|nr:hypothetical protein K3495_g9728 [Podosphaera aphanis]